MVLVGDLDFEETILLVDQYFGKFEYKELPERKNHEEPQTEIVERIVKSPSAPRLNIAWQNRFLWNKEEHLAEMVAQILSNSGRSRFAGFKYQPKT